MLQQRYFIGIDGGGTKTQCIVGDQTGTIIYVENGPSANIHSRDAAIVRKDTYQLLDTVLTKASIAKKDVEHIFAAIAGIDSDDDQSTWEIWLKEYLHREDFTVENDAFGALASGTFSKEGVVVIAGTGSIALMLHDHGKVQERVGGWGYIFGDQGSGYDLGVKALKKVTTAYDEGTHKESVFAERILAYLKVEQPSSLISKVYAHESPKQIVASLAREVLALADEGNQEATVILNETVNELVALVMRLYKKKPVAKELPLVLCGGLFQHPIFFSTFKERIGQCKLICPQFPPVVGAYALALLSREACISEDMKSNIEHSWIAKVLK